MSFEEVEKRLLERWAEELKHPRLKGKVGFEDSLRHLINLCMTCAPEEFPNYVNRLLYSIPKAWCDDEFEEELEKCTKTYDDWDFVEWCNIKLGTPENPARDDEGNIISPKPVKRSETNWEDVFTTILNLCNRHNLLIPVERVEVVSEKEEEGAMEDVEEGMEESSEELTEEE